MTKHNGDILNDVQYALGMYRADLKVQLTTSQY